MQQRYWLAEDAHRVFLEKLPELNAATNMNEATTRLRIIDTILFDILKWEKMTEVNVETYTRDVGYLDYMFGADPSSFAMVLEAKRDEIPFVLPDRQYPADPVPFGLIAQESAGAASALGQAQGYANKHGARYSAISNGHQWLLSLTFVPNQPANERLVFVFESLAAIEKRFRAFYECFSKKAVSTNLPSRRLLDARRGPPPSKLSSRIAGYPLNTERNKPLNALRGVLQLVWDEINLDTDNAIFLRECYIVAEPAEDMLRVARELLEQRSATDERLAGATVAAADAKTMIALGEAADRERPIVLMGRIGHGKSTFLKYLRHIEAKTLLENRYIQIDIDFLVKPATAAAVSAFILDQVEQQLKHDYGIELHSDAVVRHALRQELKEFRQSPKGKLLSEPGQEVAMKRAEVDFIETFTSDREKYFPRLMRHIRRGHGKSVTIFFDNLDRRPDDLQEQAFLRASAVAADWGAVVFVCLRPGTVQRSQARGVLDTIAPRVIVVSPPRTAPMLRKRFQYAAKFARRTLPDEAFTRADFSADIQPALPAAAELFDVCDHSLFRKPHLAHQYEAVANANVRLIIDYVRNFLTSNHLDTLEISEKVKEEGEYLLAEHQTLRALIYGPFIHYEPNTSRFMNLFDITRADATEHFSRLLLLEYCHRHQNSVEKYGYISLRTIHAYMSSIGYSSDQITEVVGIAFSKKCIEGRDQDEEQPELGDEVRITSLGSYHVTTLARRFVYLDAVSVDTPIIDDKHRAKIRDVRSLRDRIERARDFLRYLDDAAQLLVDAEASKCWGDVSQALANNITDVEMSLREKRAK